MAYSCKAQGFHWVPSFDHETAEKRKSAATFLIYFDYMLKEASYLCFCFKIKLKNSLPVQQVSGYS